MNQRIAVLVALALSGPASAQHLHHATPYAGLQQRTVKALSEQQIADLRTGRGMGLALAGELNGYPGPMHVIELADRLQLSAEQRQHVEHLYADMKTEAVRVGEKLIELETALDRAFAGRKISPAELTSLTGQIGQAQGELRAVHLRYHLTTADLLTTHQRQLYAELRGYR